MPDYRISWEIDWPGDSPREALDAMMLELFGGVWPERIDSFVVTSDDGEETAINYHGEEEETEEQT